MTPKLTAEQRAALLERGSPIAVEDDETHQMYFLVDPRMLNALESEADLCALRDGIADADAGRLQPLDEVARRVEASVRARFSA